MIENKLIRLVEMIDPSGSEWRVSGETDCRADRAGAVQNRT